MKQRFAEWLAEIEARIAALRAAANGTGVVLSPREARALAGEWYHWWIERRGKSTKRACEDRLSEVQDAIWACVDPNDAAPENSDDLWEDRPDVREAVRPVLADVGETAQFLAAKPIVLTNEARDLFLDYLYGDLAAALRRLIRLSEGDYSTDTYPERFPKVTQGAENGITAWELFEKWLDERKPAPGSIETWRYVFRAMNAYFEGRSAASITHDEAAAWIKGLLTAERSAATVKNNWLTASKTVFGWAVEQKHARHNPFAGIKITIPKQARLRETKALLPNERVMVLAAASATADTTPDLAARRWVPWLCAYTGARAGEITQLRRDDVLQREGIHALRITPDAGAVKNRQARVVPIHEHLIEQGFLEFVARHGQGRPLFYKPAEANKGTGSQTKKPRYAQARQRLAKWVRSIGVVDRELLPNHAWRHTFKQIADRHGISERVSDAITGHAPATVGRAYGAPTLEDMAAGLKKFPRYVVHS